jgi:hypothetical protein
MFMVKIFGDFCQFSAEKVEFFLKNQYYDQIFVQFSFILSQKGHFLDDNVSKIITLDPNLANICPMGDCLL